MTPLCPRCGYDQSGACSGWHETCPLEGTCPECGLRFEWADAFTPTRKRLQWLFEHKPRLSLGMIRSWRSWWMALVPPRFWRRVTPAHGTSASVVLWPLVLMVSMIAVGGALRAAYFYITDWAGPWTAWGGGPPRGWERWRVIAEEAWGKPLFAHWADYWNAGMFWRAVGRLYAAPAAVLGSALLCGVVLMCMTTSRRICGVKASHIVRAMVYRTAPLGVLYLVWLVDSVLVHELSMASPIVFVRRDAWLVVIVLTLLWGAWWWRSVILTGWVMPRARLAAHLIGACDVLAGVAVCTVMAPYTVGRLFA